jgi:hypothetical protein
MRRWTFTLVLLTGAMMTGTGEAHAQASVDPDQPERSAAPAVEGRIARGIVGVITDPTGAPIADARIVATSLDEPARPVPDIAILSDADGRFAWPLAPGRYRLTALLGERTVANTVAELTAGTVTAAQLTAEP